MTVTPPRMIRAYGKRTAGTWGVIVPCGRFALTRNFGDEWEVILAEDRNVHHRPLADLMREYGLRYATFSTRREALAALTVMLHAEGLHR